MLLIPPADELTLRFADWPLGAYQPTFLDHENYPTTTVPYNTAEQNLTNFADRFIMEYFQARREKNDFNPIYSDEALQPPTQPSRTTQPLPRVPHLPNSIDHEKLFVSTPPTEESGYATHYISTRLPSAAANHQDQPTPPFRTLRTYYQHYQSVQLTT